MGFVDEISKLSDSEQLELLMNMSPGNNLAMYSILLTTSSITSLSNTSLYKHWDILLGISVLSVLEGVARSLLLFNFTKFFSPLVNAVISQANVTEELYKNTYLYTSLANLWGAFSLSNCRLSLITLLAEKMTLDYKGEYSRLVFKEGASIRASEQGKILLDLDTAANSYKEQILFFLCLYSSVVRYISGIISGFVFYTLLMPGFSLMSAAKSYLVNLGISTVVAVLFQLLHTAATSYANYAKAKTMEVQTALGEVESAIQSQAILLARTRTSTILDTAENYRAECSNKLSAQIFSLLVSDVSLGVIDSIGFMSPVISKLVQIAMGTYSMEMFWGEFLSTSALLELSLAGNNVSMSLDRAISSLSSWRKFVHNHDRAVTFAAKKPEYDECYGDTIVSVKGALPLLDKTSEGDSKQLILVDRVNFTPGVHVIKGGSGLGKTTLQNYLDGVYYSDMSIARSSVLEGRKQVQICEAPNLPHVSLYKWLTELVDEKYKNNPENEAITIATINKLREELLSDYSEINEHTEVKGSSGQMARLSLLRAILPGELDPDMALKLVMVDEAVSKVSAGESRGKLWRVLHGYAQRHNAAVIAITHDRIEGIDPSQIASEITVEAQGSNSRVRQRYQTRGQSAASR